jgi:hypothetical protein
MPAPHSQGPVSVDSPAAMLAVVPHLLGFTPPAASWSPAAAVPGTGSTSRSGSTCPTHLTTPWPRPSSARRSPS